MELHTLFFILAVLLLLILVGYSVWSSRREKSRVFSNHFSQRANQPLPEETQSSVPAFAQTPSSQAQTSEASPQLNETQVAQEVERSLSSIKISLQGQQTAPLAQPEPYQQQPEATISAPIEQASSMQQTAEASVQTETDEAQPALQTVQLYMVAPQGAAFSGEAVVARLEDLGLHYDTEYQIFQRHIDTAASPTIFGVANMMQPGIFDLNTLHRFSTVGLVFFMNLPSIGNNQANFRLMLDNANALAQSLGGFVLDDQGQLFNDTTLNNYLQRL